MPDPFPPSILCPILIGRDAQVAVLTRLLDQARDPFGRGQGQVVLISGEAGIGKSRLVAEIGDQAAQQGFLRLTGRAFETDRAFPYAPLIDLLRTHQSQPPTTPSAAEARRGDVDIFVAEHVTQEQAIGLAAEQAKRQRFQRFVDFLQQQTMPLLVTVEDLHWSDDLSLECLLYLARTLTHHPIVLLLTYRNDEVQPALSSLLAALRRERITHEVTLHRLTAPQIEVMIRAIFTHPQAVRSEFVTALHTLTDGNPFFVEEVLKALVSAGDIFYTDGIWTRKALGELHIPPTVQDAVERRTQHLSPAAHELLILAAVIGRQCEFALLQQLTQADETTLLPLLKELITAQLIREETADRFVFRHALTQQTIYSSLLTRERRRLHRAVLTALESHPHAEQTPTTGELARHAQAAQAWSQLLTYAERAGEEALALYAPQTALDYFAQALSAAQQLQQPPPVNLLRLGGRAYTLVSDFANARQCYEQALRLARHTQDLVCEWQLLLDLGALAQEEDYAQAGGYFEKALALARSRQEPLALAHTLNWLGRWHSMMDEPHAALRLQREALAIFAAQREQRGMATTMSLLGWSHYVAADLYASVDAYRQAVALSREVDDRPWLIFSLTGIAMHGRDYFNLAAYWPPIAPTAAEADAQEAIQLAQQMGYRSGEVRARIWFALGLGPRGNYGEALAQAQAAQAIAKADQQPRYIATADHALGALYLDLLAWPLAERHLRDSLHLSTVVNSPMMVRFAAGLLALAFIAQQKLDDAQQLLDQALPVDAPLQSKSQRLIGCVRAELCLARADPVGALGWVDRLLSTAVLPPVADGQAGELVIPRLWQLRGEALLALRRWAEAEAGLLSALQAAEKQEMQPLIWRIQGALARLYQQQRRLQQALAALAAAQRVISELAETVADAFLRQTFMAHAAEQLPNLAPPTTLQAAKSSAAGLTAREREVATLIAAGQANRTIAERLIISERTVAKHVENILAKLNFTTRAQVAAWAVEKGLLPEQARNPATKTRQQR